MSDPLSITVGVIGILGVAAQVSSTLINFTQKVKQAPQQARAMATEVSETSVILSQLQSFLLGQESADRSRTSLLKIDDIVTIVTGCLLTFAELEDLLDQLKTEGMDTLDRVKWIKKESTIKDLIQRLQSHKASLSLMLNILNGLVHVMICYCSHLRLLIGTRNTIVEAKDSVNRLCNLMETCYQDMLSRVQALECATLPGVNSDIPAFSEEDVVSNRMVSGPNLNSNSETAQGVTRIGSFTFTKDLQRSWVYRRNKAYQGSILSGRTSELGSTRWSMLSDLSAAEVSNISVINLPITADELRSVYRSVSRPTTADQQQSVHDSAPTRPLISNHDYTSRQHISRSLLELDELDDDDDVQRYCMKCDIKLVDGKAYEVGKTCQFPPPQTDFSPTSISLTSLHNKAAIIGI
ncbi:MAG: hypothetical protein Q9164_007266 [Protoblastenia rupestris]